MAFPVADSYSGQSGEVISGGRYVLPPWIPSPGVIAAIHNNTADAVYSGSDPAINPNHPATAPWHGTTGQGDIWNGWCGHIFAPHFSRLGAIIAFGGGHNGYYGNDVYAFDLSLQLWQRLSNPFYPFTSDGTHYGDPTYGEHYDASMVPIPTQPTASHTYDLMQYLPPELGGGPKGSMILCNLTSMSPTGGRITHWSHRFDLDTRVWSRFGGNSIYEGGGNGGFGLSCLDTNRQRIWHLGPRYGGTNLKYLSFLDLQLSTPMWSLATPANPGIYSWVDSGTMEYSPELDLIVGCTEVGDSVFELWMVDPSAPAWPPHIMAHDGGALTDMGRPAVIWHAGIHAFIVWDGRDKIYKLSPPADPITGTWSVTPLAFAGASPTLGATLGTRGFKKAFYVRKINAIVSETNKTGGVYCWNTRGM